MMDPLPYIPRNPGDLITAEDWDGVQVKVKQDIAAQIGKAEVEIRKTGVDRATNAEKFAGKDDIQWLKELEGIFAPKHHEHEGLSVYRRYIKRFGSDTPTAFLKHNLGRFPLVDVYTLLPVIGKKPKKTDVIDATATDCKMLFYYGEQEAEDYDVVLSVYRDRVPLGLPLAQILDELRVDYDEDTDLRDLLNDLWTAAERDPNDEIDHCSSPWVDQASERHRTVESLKRAGEWDNLYVAMRPQKRAVGAPATGDLTTVDITHVNYHTLLVEVGPPPAQRGADVTQPPIDLMFLLRI